MTVYSLDGLLSQFLTVCCSLSSSNCCFLSYIQVSQEACKVVWYFHLFKNFTQFVVICTVKRFSIVNKAEVDFFFLMEFSSFFLWSTTCWQFDLWFLCLFSVYLYIWNFLVHIILKPALEDIEYYIASIWNACNGVAVWIFFVIVHLRIWNENWPFSVLWSLLSFPSFLASWVQHFHSIIF